MECSRAGGIQGVCCDGLICSTHGFCVKANVTNETTSDESQDVKNFDTTMQIHFTVDSWILNGVVLHSKTNNTFVTYYENMTIEMPEALLTELILENQGNNHVVGLSFENLNGQRVNVDLYPPNYAIIAGTDD